MLYPVLPVTSQIRTPMSRISQFFSQFRYDLAVMAICGISFGLGGIESLVSADSLHWGLMYGQALDVHRGLIPYRETALIYGWLTSWMQAFAIGMFGERLITIGWLTSVFYATSLFLSYRILLRFLPKYFAFFVVFWIFLIHPHFTYVWSNYYSYTFLLVAILLLPIRFQPSRRVLLAGVALGLALLCRYSSLMGIVPPFVLYWLYQLWSHTAERRRTVWGGLVLGLGAVIPLGAFAGYLWTQGAWADFICQNQTLIAAWSPPVTLPDVLTRLAANIWYGSDTKNQALLGDLRLGFFSVNFWGSLIFLFTVLINRLRKALPKSPQFDPIILVSLITLCGYLNSYHLYEVFRLINSASLGFGVIAYGIWQISRRFSSVGVKLGLLVPMVCLCFVWADGLILQRNASNYHPWAWGHLSGKAQWEDQVDVLRGKLVTAEYHSFYQRITQVLARYDRSYSIINGTNDSVLAVLSDLPRVQKLVMSVAPAFEDCCQNPARIEQQIVARKAILFAFVDPKIPGYKVVFRELWPYEVPFLGRAFFGDDRSPSPNTPLEGNVLHIVVPD
jgi:hypothetical protein